MIPRTSGLRLVAAMAVLTALLVPSGRSPADASGPYQHLVGALHNHSGYSDGWPGTTPATSYFAKGKTEGLAFMGGSEHSDNADIPITFSEGCLGPLLPSCLGTSADSLDKWNETLRQAEAASDAAYTAFRGFEWTSDRFGHINVYFSQHDTNAKIDGGYAVMDTFWKWFDTSPGLGGGADGLGTFNHPGAKTLDDADPTRNWNDFAYVPEADHRMVGIEVFNDDDEFGTGGPLAPPEGYYVHALDKGWHIGAVGAEDLHGEPGKDDYGSERWAKTVVLSNDRSTDGLRSAMLARRFYAIRHNDGLQLDFTVDGQPMGSRLARDDGDSVHVVASTNRPSATIEVVTSGGRVVGSSAGAIDTTIEWDPADRYYFMRVKEGGNWIAYSSPVWLSSVAATQGEWLAGDLHIHTCYSHDAYCGPDDDNTGPEEFYTLSAGVEERFTEAAVRGLDYLAITDHNDVRSVTDPGFGSHGVIGIPGYENSLSGHAQMLGATKIYPHGDGAAAINAMADELRADGGVFQINHPGDGLTVPLDDACGDTSDLDWRYGFAVEPDTLEVWNIGHVVQPPLPAGNSNDDSIKYWECWLNRGVRVGATGGSDSHWLTLSAVQGPGNPTTWVFANERTDEGILQALDEGRTSISLVPPMLGAPRLILEADADGDGTYESMIGDEVPPGTQMRVRTEGISIGGLLQIRANGTTLVDKEPLAPGTSYAFTSPDEAGWVYAKLSGPDLRDERAATCDPIVGQLPLEDIGGEDGRTTYCRNAIVELALTSPIYMKAAPEPVATTLAYTGPSQVSGLSATLSARLADVAGTPVAGRAVSFANRGTTVTATTDADGTATATMDFPDHGKSQVVDIAFAGDNDYLPSATTARVSWGRPKR